MTLGTNSLSSWTHLLQIEYYQLHAINNFTLIDSLVASTTRHKSWFRWKNNWGSELSELIPFHRSDSTYPAFKESLSQTFNDGTQSLVSTCFPVLFSSFSFCRYIALKAKYILSSGFSVCWRSPIGRCGTTDFSFTRQRIWIPRWILTITLSVLTLYGQ